MTARIAFRIALNHKRRAAGLIPLTESPRLVALARFQAWKIASDGHLHHDNFIQRMKGDHFQAHNECVGYTVGSAQPRTMLARFMASPPHRHNLMATNISCIGVCVKRHQKRVYYAVICGG